MTTPSSLDQDVVRLAKAIREHETGNRPVKGATGELPSRYQFMPATWKSSAQKYLGDANAPITLENENKVAYLKIKEWKDAGYNPGQIASMWNSGNPDPYLKGNKGVGKSSQNPNVTYNVPKYVNSVTSRYRRLKIEESMKADAAQYETEGGEHAPVLGRVVGVGKGIASTVRGAGKLGEQFLQGALRTILPKSLEPKFGLAERRPTGAEELIPEELTKPRSKEERQGFAAEQIAEFLVPSTKVAKLEKGLSLIPRALTEAAVFGGQTAIQKGSVTDPAVRDAAIMGAAFPIGGAALKAGYQGLKATAAPLAQSFAARTINSLIKPLGKDFAYGKNPGLGVAREGIVANSLEELEPAVLSARNAVGREIGEFWKGFSPTLSAGRLSRGLSSPGMSQSTVRLTSALSPIDDAVRVAIKNNNRTLAQRLLDVKKAITEELIPIIDKAGQVGVASKGKVNLEKVSLPRTQEILRQVGDLTKWTGAATDDQIANKALKQVYGMIREAQEKAVGQVDSRLLATIRALNERYANLSSAAVATKHRAILQQRQNLISLPGHINMIGGALMSAIATGGATIPMILSGATGATLDKLLGSTLFKSRMAAWLARAPAAEKAVIFSKIPVLRGAIERAFGGSLDDLGNVGLGIADVTKQSTKQSAIGSLAVMGGLAGGAAATTKTTESSLTPDTPSVTPTLENKPPVEQGIDEQIEEYAKTAKVNIDSKGKLKSSGSTLAIENNNPGNLRFAGQPNATRGRGGFAKFPTPELGYRALLKQLQKDQSRNLTLSGFIKKYAPPQENDYKRYLKFMEGKLDVTSNTNIADVDLFELAKYIAKFESQTEVNSK